MIRLLRALVLYLRVILAVKEIDVWSEILGRLREVLLYLGKLFYSVDNPMSRLRLIEKKSANLTFFG